MLHYWFISYTHTTNGLTGSGWCTLATPDHPTPIQYGEFLTRLRSAITGKFLCTDVVIINFKYLGAE